MLYDDLTDDEIKALSDAVNALSEPLSQPDRGGPVLTMRLIATTTSLGGGAAAAGVAAGAFAAGRAHRDGATTTAEPGSRSDAYPFHGEHQAGIVTPAQDRLHFAAFDVTTDSRDAAGRAAHGLDRGRGPDDPGLRRRPGRCRPRAPATCPPTTPVRRSGCRRAD